MSEARALRLVSRPVGRLKENRHRSGGWHPASLGGADKKQHLTAAPFFCAAPGQKNGCIVSDVVGRAKSVRRGDFA
jgi:hypothetical protein